MRRDLTGPRPSRAARAALVGGVLATLVAVPWAGRAAVPGRELSLRFDSGDPTANSGSAALEVSTVATSGGAVQPAARSADGDGAVRLPAYSETDPALAALRVVDSEGTDDLAPLRSPFAFGADFALDAQSQGSATDNGNNLVQRGRYDDPMQYKLQVDGGRPSCRVRGSAGAVSVASDRTVRPGEWYRARCSRDRRVVTLVLTRLATGASWTYRARGPLGSVQPASRAVPLSVGAKLEDDGTFASSADQFNGQVDNVFVAITN